VTVNDTASVSARPGAPSLGFEISAGLATPLTAVGDVYGVAPALRVGFAMSRGSFQLTAHVEGFSGPLRATIYGVQRDSIFGYGGMDIEPMLRLMDGPVEIWCGARVAGGVLGRQISGLGSAGEERQATPFGFAGPLLRMDLPRAPLAPYLSVSSGVALTSTDGAARVNAHLSVWLGFRKELLSF
jgi:hypothetical protein